MDAHELVSHYGIRLLVLLHTIVIFVHDLIAIMIELVALLTIGLLLDLALVPDRCSIVVARMVKVR